MDAEEQSTNQIRASEEEVWLLGYMYSEYKNFKRNKLLQFDMIFDCHQSFFLFLQTAQSMKFK